MQINLRCLYTLNFNSIKVRLEQPYYAKKYMKHSYFNSIKVRLEQCGRRDCEPYSPNFNSIKVRLEHIHD